ncbi:MAG: 2-hydroxy-3-oxopropionate reductase [Pseudomonadota bacterium]|jgi:3-hydroxyisobutyrate dehydrogenase-like beta-hydroxyacid dehydrogenase
MALPFRQTLHTTRIKERALQTPRIGMIGLGLMGLGIATNIVQKGFALTAMSHAGNQPLDDLLKAGATTAPTAQAVAQASDIVILCVNGSAQVEAILAGDTGLLAGLRAGMTVIDCSTSIPASTLQVADQLQQLGVHFMDAAMTRTPNEAMQGRLNLLVGGDAALLETCRPLLSTFAENIVHAGPVGSGHRMKLLHNFVSLGSVTLLAEAAACARRSGIDDAVFVDVLEKGGGWGAALERLKPYLLEGKTSGLRFSMGNALKDLTYYGEMASETGSHQAAATALQGTLAAACKTGDPQKLLPELVSQLSAGALKA